MTRTRVAARAIDLLHDDRCLGKAEAGAAVLFRDQGSEPSRLRQRIDERFRIPALGVDTLPVRGLEAGTQRAHGFAQSLVTIGCGNRIHERVVVTARIAAA